MVLVVVSGRKWEDGGAGTAIAIGIIGVKVLGMKKKKKRRVWRWLRCVRCEKGWGVVMIVECECEMKW